MFPFFCFGPAISQHRAVCFSVDSGICDTLHPSSAPQASPLAVDLPSHSQKQRAPAAGSERFVRVFSKQWMQWLPAYLALKNKKMKKSRSNRAGRINDPFTFEYQTYLIILILSLRCQQICEPVGIVFLVHCPDGLRPGRHIWRLSSLIPLLRAGSARTDCPGLCPVFNIFKCRDSKNFLDVAFSHPYSKKGCSKLWYLSGFWWGFLCWFFPGFFLFVCFCGFWWFICFGTTFFWK